MPTLELFVHVRVCVSERRGEEREEEREREREREREEEDHPCAWATIVVGFD